VSSADTQIAGYLEHLQTQRKLSLHTLDNYRRDLEQLKHFIAKQLPARELASLTQADIRRCTSQLHAHGLSPSSIARKLSAWRGMFAWLAFHHTIAANPVDGVRAPKRTKSLPKALGVDDAVRLVSSTVNSDEQSAVRDACNKAMFELLYSSGLRVAELTSLDMHHVKTAAYESQSWIALDDGELTVTGKGSKRRSVPMGTAAIAALRDWLAVRPQLQRADTGHDAYALFLSARGHRITAREVQRRIKAHAQALGIPANVHPHVLRHSFASHVLQSSGDLRAVQEMLGHASIASTQVYTSLDFQRLAQVYDAAHPRAKKQSGR
jgi:integrase/recombinase XerC